MGYRGHVAKPKDPSGVRFGASLMRLRKGEGRTQEWLASRLGCSASHVGNVENGRCPLQPSRVKGADDALQAEGRLSRLYKELYQPEQVDWLDALYKLLTTAEVVREYHNFLVPGRLQTEDYARAVIRASAPWFTSRQVEETVEVRSARSAAFLGEEGPRYHVVLDDAVALRAVADFGVMREQFARLTELMEEGRVILQVYSWENLPQLGLGGPFLLLSSARTPDVLHVESVYMGQTTDDPGAVRQYGMLFSELQARARSPGETLVLLKERMKELR